MILVASIHMYFPARKTTGLSGVEKCCCVEQSSSMRAVSSGGVLCALTAQLPSAKPSNQVMTVVVELSILQIKTFLLGFLNFLSAPWRVFLLLLCI